MSNIKTIIADLHQQLLSEPVYARLFRFSTPDQPIEHTVHGSRLSDDISAVMRIRSKAYEDGLLGIAELPTESLLELLREVLGRPQSKKERAALESLQAAILEEEGPLPYDEQPRIN